MEAATVELGTTGILFGSWRMIVMRHLVSSAFPGIRLPSRTIHPAVPCGKRGCGRRRTGLLGVSCRARVTARPPTPNRLAVPPAGDATPTGEGRRPDGMEPGQAPDPHGRRRARDGRHVRALGGIL